MLAFSWIVRTQSTRRLPSFVLGSSSSIHAQGNIFASPSLGSTRSYSSPKKPKYNKPPRNLEITHPNVQLVNPETNRLDPPRPYEEILNSVALKDYFVELVSSDPPIVKIVNKREANAARKEMKERKRTQPRNELKEVQMTWGVGVADLTHKLKKVQEELERGNRVTLVFAPKSKQPVPKPREMATFLNEVTEKVSAFAKESQPRTIEKNVAVIYLHAVKRENAIEDA